MQRRALERLPLSLTVPPDGAGFTLLQEWRAKGTIRCRRHACLQGVDLWLETVRPETGAPRLVLSIADAGELTRHAYANLVTSIDATQAVCAALEPRLAGCNDVPREAPPFPRGARLRGAHTLMYKAMAILGQTPVSMLIQDIRLAINHLMATAPFRDCALTLFGIGRPAVAALYAGLLDQRVSALMLADLPGSHADGVPLIGILREIDIPQAVGLMAPRPVALTDIGHTNWNWPNRAYARSGAPSHLIRAADRREAFKQLFAVMDAAEEGGGKVASRDA